MAVIESSNSYKAEITLYRETLIECREARMTRSEAKAYAKLAVYEAFPYIRAATLSVQHPGFWSMVSVVLAEIYPQKPEERPEQQLPLPTATKAQPFSVIVRSLAATGFIPFKQYLEPIFGDNVENLAPYISKMKAEGTYKIEKNSHGYICTLQETLAQRAEREAAEAAAAAAKLEAERIASEKRKMAERIDALQAEINSLRAKL